MESEKVKEIKKALECNADYEHHDKLSYIDGYKCKLVAYADILTLINELEKENGELKKHITEVEKGIINIARERNKKDELASKFIDSYNDSLKQFAEKVKEKALSHCKTINCYELKFIEETIDELIREYKND